jgi:UDP-N-acetylmuramate--alanine ligase
MTLKTLAQTSAPAGESVLPAPPDPLGFSSAHLVGIGGCGMSALARALMACGVAVSGSDLKTGGEVERLRAAGARTFDSHEAANLGDAEVLVYSTAISEANPELVRARAEDRRILHRSDALALFLATRDSILVSGTHGKTTTTALAGLALEAAGADPWCFVGGMVPAFAGHVRVGGLTWAVAEADESDGSFERLPASHLIVTNIEDDHLDYWQTSEAMIAGYRRVIERVARDGVVLMCHDDPGASALRRTLDRRVLTYSVRPRTGDFSAGAIKLAPYHSEFDFYHGKLFFGRFQVGVPGLQNVSNAVAALGLLTALGGDPLVAAPALSDFHGVGRRFEVKGRAAGVTVVDDYAHHPTEVLATIEAARALRQQLGGRLVAVFQPHRYTRTQLLMNSFAVAFTGCDEIVLTDVYAAGEQPIEGVNSEALAARLDRAGFQRVTHIPNRADIAPRLAPRLREGDLVLTLGAGDNTKTSTELLEQLAKTGPCLLGD